jgi:DNA-binding CsgD family transcriptional regulator
MRLGHRGDLVTLDRQDGPTAAPRRVVGRDAEIAVLRDLIAAGGDARALTLVGPPGVGKTTLCEAAIGIARDRGHRVLTARATSADVPTPFAALIDLCDELDDADLAALPEPQRDALEVALFRARPRTSPPSSRAIALGFRTVVRSMCARTPVLLAIDDVQWLDPLSRDALTFLAHRLREEDICVVMTRSTDRPTEVEAAFGPSRLRFLPAGPLSFGAIRRVLLDRLELSLPRALLHRVVDITEGNPLFVLELGRELLQRGVPASADDLPIPAQIEDLLNTRIAALPDPPRQVLTTLTLCPDIAVDELLSVTGQPALDQAIDLGLVQIDGRRVRMLHPLLGPTALRGVGQGAQRELHRSLARALADPERQAMHLALATPGSDQQLSESVAGAAVRASARGARHQTVALAEHALRLTPADSATRRDRVLALAQYLETAGEMQRLTDLLTLEIDSVPAGRPRAWAYLMLSEGTGSRSMDDLADLQRRALAEAPDDPVLRARVLAKKASNTAASLIVDIPRAETWASEAVELTSDATADVRRSALYALAWARAMSGRPVEDLCELSQAGSDANSYIAVTPERVAAQRHVWRGEIPPARALIEALLTLADERGEIESYALMRLHMCELHLRVGEWDSAEELLSEWAETADRQLMFRPKYERCRAVLAGGRGDLAATQEWAAIAIARGRETGSRWDELEGVRAGAIGSLLAREPAAAAAALLPVWSSLEAEGVDEPGVFPVAPELVQGLVEAGDLEPAQRVTSRLAELAARDHHPWAAITVDRCQAMVTLAGSGTDVAASQLEAAAEAYDAIGLRFDAARCRLSLGRAQRRRRQWGSARGATEQAIAMFDAIGSPGWSQQARDELGRMGASRTSAVGELTASEQRTAELAAAGLSNKEIARELSVGVHTVEVHLSRVYAKLGVRSRGQLTVQLHGSGPVDH